jgi:hypothetical protein
MAELLRALYLDPRIGPEILQSLSVGGVDGTTRNRFKGTLASRRVRAKTGTLDGKSCLSGLVGDGDDVVAFSMLVQGFRGRALAAVRASQVGAVNAIMRYVREGTGEHIELPAGFDEQAGTDVETAGEESDAEGEADPSVDLKLAPGEDAIDAYLRQSRAQAGGAGGAGGRSATTPPPLTSSSPSSFPAPPSTVHPAPLAPTPPSATRPPVPTVVPYRQPPVVPSPVPAPAPAARPATALSVRGAGGAGAQPR